MSGNLWHAFTAEFPILSHVPVLKHWAFGVYARGYHETKVGS